VETFEHIVENVVHGVTSAYDTHRRVSGLTWTAVAICMASSLPAEWELCLSPIRQTDAPGGKGEREA